MLWPSVAFLIVVIGAYIRIRLTGGIGSSDGSPR